MRMSYSISQFKAVLNGLGYSLDSNNLPNDLGSSPDSLSDSADIELDCCTQIAIRAFQTHYQLPITGTPDLQTQEKARQLIRNLQHSLNLAVNVQLPISEFYGDGTTKAVQLFQHQHGLPVTGIACSQVRQALEDSVKRQLRQQLNCLIKRVFWVCCESRIIGYFTKGASLWISILTDCLICRV